MGLEVTVFDGRRVVEVGGVEYCGLVVPGVVVDVVVLGVALDTDSGLGAASSWVARSVPQADSSRAPASAIERVLANLSSPMTGSPPDNNINSTNFAG